jgi:hypothetical protein
MPDFAGNTPGVCVGLHDNDRGIVIENSQRRGMDVKIAEATAKGLVFRRSKILFPEEEGEMPQKWIANVANWQSDGSNS